MTKVCRLGAEAGLMEGLPLKGQVSPTLGYGGGPYCRSSRGKVKQIGSFIITREAEIGKVKAPAPSILAGGRRSATVRDLRGYGKQETTISISAPLCRIDSRGFTLDDVNEES